MQRPHPYGGYSQGPPPRGERGGPAQGPSGYGAAQYDLPPHLLKQATHPTSPYGPGQGPYGAAAGQDYRESGSFQSAPLGPMAGAHDDYRSGAAGMPPSRDRNVGGPAPSMMGAAPMPGGAETGLPPQYGPPIHYDGRAPPSGGSDMGSRAAGGGYGAATGTAAPQHYQVGPSPSPAVPGRMPTLGGPPGPSYGSAAPYAAGPPTGPRGPSQGREDDFGPRKRSRLEEDGANMSHEQFLKERLKRERPCRTLFVRNIDFRADMGEMRRHFESFGEVKSFFDLVEKRGLAFISYFDLRAAEAAKNAMQGSFMNGRELDVHYSLPREAETTKRCDREKDQGTLFLVLKRAPHDLSDQELTQVFAHFGEIKNLRRYKDQGNCRFLEYWDCRACKAAHDALINTQYRGGTWDVKFAWDAATPDRVADMPRTARERDWARESGQAPNTATTGFGSPGGRPPYGGMEPPSAPAPPSYGFQAGSGSESYPPRSGPQANVPAGYGGQGSPPRGGYGPPVPAGPAASFRPPRPPTGYGPGSGAGAPPPTGPSGAHAYGTKRPYDYDDNAASAAPPQGMRRWGQPAAQQNGQRPPPSPASAFNYREPGQYGGGAVGSYGPPPQPSSSNGPAPPSGPAEGGAPYASSAGPRNEYSWRPPPAGPAQRSPAAGGAPAGSATAPAGRGDDRLEQAQKVQQLLASLKPGAGATASPGSAANGAGQGATPASAQSGSATAWPPPPAHSPANGAVSASASSPPAPGLPSNIAALLQMAQQQSSNSGAQRR